MPTFIVRRANQEPKFAEVDGDEIVIGRDPSCAVVLAEPTVSRQHLVIRKYPPAQGGAEPQYIIDGVKPTNPVMINGEFIRERILLKEADELQLGDTHVVFSLRRDAQAHYIKESSHYDGVCSPCGWTGRLGRHNRSPRCPACGAPITKRTDDVTGGGNASLADLGSTSYLAPVDLAKMHERMQIKTRARLRSDTMGGAGYPLNPGKAVTIGGAGKDVSANGMLLGGSASVAWEDDGWVARWQGLVSRMQHNGDGTKVARLRKDDRLTVGSTVFHLIIE